MEPIVDGIYEAFPSHSFPLRIQPPFDQSITFLLMAFQWVVKRENSTFHARHPRDWMHDSLLNFKSVFQRNKSLQNAYIRAALDFAKQPERFTESFSSKEKGLDLVICSVMVFFEGHLLRLGQTVIPVNSCMHSFMGQKAVPELHLHKRPC